MTETVTEQKLQVHFLRDFRELDSLHDAAINVGLVCFDAENVVVPYKGDKVWPEYIEHVATLGECGIRACMLSNMTETSRAEHIAGQLGVPFFHKTMGRDLHDGYTGLPSKSHPEMYRAAVLNVGFGSNGNRAVMVDDQLKNMRGAAQVPEFSTYLWTLPRGLRTHPGVLLFRAIEVPLGFGKIAAQNFNNVRNGIHTEF